MCICNHTLSILKGGYEMSSKIKINPITKEIEIEVSDDFLFKYFDSLGLFIKKSRKVKLTKGKNKTSNIQKKKSNPDENYNTVIEYLKLNKGIGTTIKDIVETTELNKLQVGYEMRKGMKRGVIKQTEKGVYEYINDNV